MDFFYKENLNRTTDFFAFGCFDQKTKNEMNSTVKKKGEKRKGAKSHILCIPLPPFICGTVV